MPIFLYKHYLSVKTNFPKLRLSHYLMVRNFSTDVGALDTFGRPLESLRLSVVDRCDLRCAYCMPEEDYTWLPKDDILTFDEIERTVDAFGALGVRKVRLTGGEPLLRGGITELVHRLAGHADVQDLAMTTNATQLSKWAEQLQQAGLQRVTVSLDTLNPARFETLTRRAVLDRVIAGIREAARVAFSEIKINTVVIRGFNDDELIDIVEFAREVGAEARFIEYMDVGGATLWSMERVYSRADILTLLQNHYGAVEEISGRGTAPAECFRLPDGTRFGIIASTTEPFCASCDRSRVTADGMWYLCLYANAGFNLREWLRDGLTQTELVEKIRLVWEGRRDRGAEDRLTEPTRGALYRVEELKVDPHREMHTRGG